MSKITQIKPKNIEEDILSIPSTIREIKKIKTIEDTENLEDYSGKEFLSFVKSIEKMVRGSFEYREYIQFLKTELDLNTCHFYKNMNANLIPHFSVEIHHHPFTLYDIISTMFNYYEKNGQLSTLNSFQFAENIMKLHYDNLVGIIPLSKTIHELAHEDQIFINCNYCFGNWKEFVKKYKIGFTETLIDKYNEIKSLSKLETYKEKNEYILSKHFTYLKIDGVEIPKYITLDNLKKKIA